MTAWFATPPQLSWPGSQQPLSPARWMSSRIETQLQKLWHQRYLDGVRETNPLSADFIPASIVVDVLPLDPLHERECGAVPECGGLRPHHRQAGGRRGILQRLLGQLLSDRQLEHRLVDLI